MSDAKARAAARREAILAKKSDRLAKFKTTARDEAATASDSAADDPPLADLPSLNSSPTNHIRYTSNSPRTTYTERNTSPSLPSLTSDHSDPRRQQQERFLRAIVRDATPPISYTPPIAAPQDIPDIFAGTPLAKLLNDKSPFMQMPDMASSVDPEVVSAKMPLWEKLLPLLHIISTLCFLLYFVFWNPTFESGIPRDTGHGGLNTEPVDLPGQGPETIIVLNPWRRWADLSRERPQFGWDGEPKILWAFVSLQIFLQSLRVFVGAAQPRIPSLIQMALPHLPEPLPHYIKAVFRWLQIAGLFLDDIAVFLVGLGVIVYASAWLV